jgi:hypothetical protein
MDLFSTMWLIPLGVRASHPDPYSCLLQGVTVCLLDSYATVEEGVYPVRPPVTCIDISHVAEKTLNLQVR